MEQEQKHIVLDKQEIARDTFLIKVIARDIARKALPGQFVIVRIDSYGERIPLTIAETNSKEGTITLVFLRIGFTTSRLAQLKKSDLIEDLLGPLGHGSDLRAYHNIVFVGGGVGNAELYPVAAYYHDLRQGSSSIIIAAKSKEHLFWSEKFRKTCDTLYICTDDGSAGRKGFVTDALAELLAQQKGTKPEGRSPEHAEKRGEQQSRRIDCVYSVGPVPMMERVAQITAPYSIKTLVSLNSIMIDGTGMCGSCRITYGGKTKFVCVEGPDFDAALVDFNELKTRGTFFKEKECAITHQHACRRNE